MQQTHVVRVWRGITPEGRERGAALVSSPSMPGMAMNIGTSAAGSAAAANSPRSSPASARIRCNTKQLLALCSAAATTRGAPVSGAAGTEAGTLLGVVSACAAYGHLPRLDICRKMICVTVPFS